MAETIEDLRAALAEAEVRTDECRRAADDLRRAVAHGGAGWVAPAEVEGFLAAARALDSRTARRRTELVAIQRRLNEALSAARS